MANLKPFSIRDKEKLYAYYHKCHEELIVQSNQGDRVLLAWNILLNNGKGGIETFFPINEKDEQSLQRIIDESPTYLCSISKPLLREDSYSREAI